MPTARPRKPLAAVAGLAAFALVLTACGSEDSGGSETAGTVKVEAAADAKSAPKVTIANAPYKVTETQTKVLKEGKGTALTDQDIARVNLVAVNGTSGKEMTSTWGKAPTALYLGQEDLLAGLKKGLIGAKPTSQVQISIPPADAFGEGGNSNMGVGGEDTLVFVVDVISGTKMLSEATGKAVAPKKGLPTVAFTKGKPAKITSPKSTPPTTTVVQQLITGTGAKVQAGQTVRVTYTGALWKDNSIFDASANREPGTFDFQAGAGSVIKAWDKAVVGQPVGSRLLVVVPPADGYGAAGSPPKISGTDTLVFVVDILAAY